MQYVVKFCADFICKTRPKFEKESMKSIKHNTMYYCSITSFFVSEIGDMNLNMQWFDICIET